MLLDNISRLTWYIARRYIKTKNFVHLSNVTFLEWPGNSFDINPFENMCKSWKPDSLKLIEQQKTGYIQRYYNNKLQEICAKLWKARQVVKILLKSKKTTLFIKYIFSFIFLSLKQIKRKIHEKVVVTIILQNAIYHILHGWAPFLPHRATSTFKTFWRSTFIF